METLFDSDRAEYECTSTPTNESEVSEKVKKTELKPNLIKNWTIENWSGSFVICGNIYNDTRNRFPDGTPIHTSRVEHIDFVNGIAKTKNSTYNLELKGNTQ